MIGVDVFEHVECVATAFSERLCPSSAEGHYALDLNECWWHCLHSASETVGMLTSDDDAVRVWKLHHRHPAVDVRWVM